VQITLNEQNLDKEMDGSPHRKKVTIYRILRFTLDFEFSLFLRLLRAPLKRFFVLQLILLLL